MWEEIILKTNDLFYLKVNSKYCNKLYIHVVEQLKRNEYLVRFAIPSDNPDISVEGVKLEYVKTRFVWYEERFLPTGGADVYKKQIEERSKTKFCPNKYGMLFTYLTVIRINKSFVNTLCYIGNFVLKKPIDEFVPWTIHNMKYIYFSNEIENKIFECYELYNLEQDERFDLDVSNKCRMKQQQIIDEMDKYLDSFNT